MKDAAANDKLKKMVKDQQEAEKKEGAALSRELWPVWAASPSPGLCVRVCMHVCVWSGCAHACVSRAA